MGSTPSARRLGWAAFDTPEARRVSAGHARVAVTVLSLQIVLLQLILAAVYPEDSGIYYSSGGLLRDAPIIFLGLALLYVAFIVAVGLDADFSEVLGYVLCGASFFFWLLVLVGAPTIYSNPPRSSWVVLVSIFDAVCIVAGLFVLQERVREPRAQPAA